MIEKVKMLKQTQVVAAIEQAVLSASASLLSSYRWYSLFVKQKQQAFFWAKLGFFYSKVGKDKEQADTGSSVC